MRNKRTKTLLILLALLLIAALFCMVACQDKAGDEEEDEPSVPDKGKTNLEFTQYMNKIHTGLTTGETRLSSVNDYYVASSVELYTSEENLTVYYEAVYKDNRRLGQYYIRVFDSDKHIERLNVYYDASDLYITMRDLHYVIRDFGTLLVFNAFDTVLDVLDIGDLVYGATMQKYFNEVTQLSQILTKEDFTYARAGENGESIALGGRPDFLLGPINASITGFTEQIGTTFDAVSDHYLGFQLSRLLRLQFGSINIEELRFNLSSGMLTSTTANVNGLIQGENTKYSLKLGYAFDETTDEIAAAKELPKAYVYVPVTPNVGSFEGTATFPDVRDGSPFDIALDYDVNPKNNAENRYTMRIYDQMATNDEFSQTSKYANIKELVSSYYRDEITYLNTEGLYAYLNTAVALAALRLPKIYFTGVNLSGLMTLAYSDLLQLFNVVVSPKEREETAEKKRLYNSIMSAIESDVAKKSISFTLTEDLIKEIRGDNTPVAVLLGEMVGVDEETVLKYVGDDFFELMRIVVTYHFGTHNLTIDVYEGTELLGSIDLVRIDYYGIVYPADLNDLTYAEFKEPEVVTATYKINANPYGAESVDVSGFFGAFVGDSTGKNTPLVMSTGQSISAEGQVSEYYITNYNNEREAVTTLSIRLYLENANRKTRTLLMEVATDPINNENFLVTTYTQVGSYDASNAPIHYVIPRATVSAELDKLQGEESVFSNTTGLSAFLRLYGAVDKNARTYTSDGYFGVNLMVSDTNDPVQSLVGIPNTNATVQAKITFDVLDLSALDVNLYSTPYVHTVDDVATSSIYSAGSKWKETAPVTVDGRRIDMYVTYEQESITIETGKTDYTPVAYLFGKPFSYALHIVNVAGTYKIKSVTALNENDVLIIDPAFYSAVPTTISVMFEGGEEGELPCEIPDFPDARITADGYNLSLLAGIKQGVTSDRLIIGRDSIASMEKEIYVAVINRQVIALTESGGADKVYVDSVKGEQVPVVAEFVADPYTYAMKQRLASQGGDVYDYLAEQIDNEKVQIFFHNVYGTEEVENNETGEFEIRDLTYDGEGLNRFYVSDMPLRWEFSTEPFSWRGETRYAIATYGTAENERNLVKFAVKVEITSRIVTSVRIDDYAEGTYLIDVLNENTYAIPTTTTEAHTVRIVFEGGVTRIVSLTRSALIGDDEYCSQYVYGQLVWEGTSGLSARLNLAGSRGLFGAAENASNVTSATFGSGLSDELQNVKLNVIAPSRVLESEDYETDYLVTRIESDLTMTGNQASLVRTARFTAPTSASTDDSSLTADTFAINPYNRTIVLPDTVWLYVRVEDGSNARREWVEYPVRWTTTDSARNELNIVKTNAEGKFVLAHPVTRETKLIVYGQVGTTSRSIWLAMRLLNMASDIRSYVLYLPDGSTYYDSSSGQSEESISIDPYLSYAAALPSRFTATLGSGLTVEGDTDWYYGEYPLIRLNNDAYQSTSYDAMYRDDGYYMFSVAGSSGGTIALKMTIAQGDVSNDVYLQASVSARTILTDDDTGSSVLDVVNVFNADGTYKYDDGDKYAGDGNPGYVDVNYYAVESTVLLNSLQAYYDNGGVGIAGFAIRELANESVLYAKRVKWTLSGLERVISALKKEISERSFTVMGTIDEGKRNQKTVTMTVTINRQKSNLASIGLTLSQDMVNKDVYAIENDMNGDRAIDVATEGSKAYMTNVTFYRNVQYKKFFALEDGEEGYTDSTFAGFMYVAIDKTFMLSRYSSGAYTSPYDYFSYLFGSMKLTFDTDADETASASANITLLGRTTDFFNASVLGLEPSTLETDARGTARSYSFLILEKLSAGSAVDRYLVIVSAEKATAESLVRQDVVDALGSDLSELYPDRYNLPTIVEVSYAKTDKSGSYKAKFAVEKWTPTERSRGVLGTEELTGIAATHIDVLSGSEYELYFTLPDSARAPVTAREFTLTVTFLQKDVEGSQFDAQAAVSLYDVTRGSINVKNAYAFLVENANAASRSERFILRTENVPTTIGVSDTLHYKTQRGNDLYEVAWRFVKTAFAEEIFRTGTQTTNELGEVVNDGEIIAQYTFYSYYHNGERVTQTLTLRLVLEPMAFYGLESDTLTITTAPEQAGDTSGNERKNTIEIDPYVMTGDTFRLPSVVTVLFNGTQRYTFSNVEYALINASGSIIPDSWLTTVPYGENGHNLRDPDLDEDKSILKLAMFIRGYTQDSGSNGIPIYLHFLRHEITDAAIPNAYYDADGKIEYEYDNGKLATEAYEPVRKTYTAYATSGETRIPIYYIDPYNKATFALPNKAKFEFRTEPGVYHEYKVVGWQYYDVLYETYVDFEYVAIADLLSDTTRFYVGNGDASGFYNPGADAYEGGAYALRGYIKVGSDKQYFDVLCVVLTRKLRTTVILNEEYTVTYDFTDPIAAMLADVPAMLGEDAFVDYDKYTDEIDVTMSLAGVPGTYSFTIAEGDRYSQKVEGTAQNHAVTPEILWDDEYLVDLDGDGNMETVTFEELTTIGYDGEIGGNLYRYDLYLTELIRFYTLKANAEYDRLIAALSWDTLFGSDGEPSTSLSAGARVGIKAEYAQYRQEVLYAAYKILTETQWTEEDVANGQGLDALNVQVLSFTLFEQVLRDMNVERTTNGLPALDRNDPEDCIPVVGGIYEQVKEAYEEAQAIGATTSEATIYAAWEKVISTYGDADVTTSKTISANQALKAKHFINVYNTVNLFNAEEKKRIDSQTEILRNNLYNNINADVKAYVYAMADDAERAILDELSAKWAVAGNAALGESLAFDQFKSSYAGNSALGVKGEETNADVTLPVITLVDLTVNGTTTPKSVRFNKFNFSSIDKSFTVTFEVSYEAIYAKMLAEAEAEAIASFRDEKKTDTIRRYEEDSVKEAVDAVNPKILNALGEYDSLLNFTNSFGTVTGAFSYEKWISATNSEKDKYGAFWTTLYSYRREEAIKVVTYNVPYIAQKINDGLTGYATLSTGFSISVEDFESVVEALRFIKIPLLASEILADAESPYDLDSVAGRRDAIAAIAAYVTKNDPASDTAYKAYVKLGLNGNYSTREYKEYNATDELLQTAERAFLQTVFPAIAEQRIASILSARDIALAEGSNELAEPATEAKRREAIRDLATYLIEEDVELRKLDAIYAETEDGYLATLMKNALSSEYAALATAGSRAMEQDSDQMDDPSYGYAILFEKAYGTTFVNTLYAMVHARLNGAVAVYNNEIVTKYQGKRHEKAAIIYACLNSANATISDTATTFFDFMMSYAGTSATPYDRLLARSDLFSLTGLTAEQIEKRNDDEGSSISSDCLLYYATATGANADILRANCTSFTNADGTTMTPDDVTALLKRRNLFEKLYARATGSLNVATSAKSVIASLRESARREHYLAGANALLSWAGESLKEALVGVYDTTGAQANMKYYAFTALVKKAEAEGAAKGERYVASVEEYIEAHRYEREQRLVEALYDEYEDLMHYGAAQSFTDGGKLADEFLRARFEDRGYLTPESYEDDYHDEESLTIVAREMINGYNLGAADEDRIVQFYLCDPMLRAIVYYFETVATEEQRTVVREVLEMYVGSDLSDRLEHDLLVAASRGRLLVTDGKTVGQNAYLNLQGRDDLGAGATDDIAACSYVVWLRETMDCVAIAVETYSADVLAVTEPYPTRRRAVTDVMTSIVGAANENELTTEQVALVREIALQATRSTIYNSILSALQYETHEQTEVADALEEKALEYAYDRMYETRSERGTYVYRATFDAILEDIVRSQGTEMNRLRFETARDIELEKETEVLRNAVENAVEATLFAETFDAITLFTLTADEFAVKAYAFMTGHTTVQAPTLLFGPDRNGLGGIVGNAVSESKAAGHVDGNGQYGKYVVALADWWTIDSGNTVYGVLSEEERKFIAQINNQAYYQTKALLGESTLSTESRKELSCLTMLTSIYLFLEDMEKELEAMPADFFTAGNEKEKKAYLIDRMLNGDLMTKTEARSLSLAKTTLRKLATDLARADAVTLGSITSTADKVTPLATDYTVFTEQMAYSLLYASGEYHPATATEEEREARSALFAKYYAKAISYAEYTSVLGSPAYDREAAYPLRTYTDAIYKAVTGYDMAGNSSIEAEETRVDDFGVLSFGYYYKAAGNDYEAAIELMQQARTVYDNDYVSEDFATEDDRHVIFFDRAEWMEFRNNDGTFAADAFYSDRNVFIANPNKTEQTEDVSGGMGYVNALKMQGYEYRLSDFTTVDLFFETTSDDPYNALSANILHIDALNPALPSKAYAKGYATVNNVVTEVPLGEVSITEYSSEFYKLVYNYREPTADDAYQVTIQAANGFVFRIINQVKVGYRDRSIRRVYLETDAYAKGQAVKQIEPGSDFNGLYDTYDQDLGSNVIYIEPTDTNLILEEQRSYTMPSTIYLRCVSDDNREAVIFDSVTWDLSNVTYGLKGTGASGKSIRVKSYAYVDEDGARREIEYDFRNESATMKVYDKTTGELLYTRVYEVKEDDAIDWNMVLLVPDQSLESLADVTTQAVIGRVGEDGVVDATSIQLNPYYPEYPNELQLNLQEGVGSIELKNSDWLPDGSMLRAIRSGNLQAEEDGSLHKFVASFYYLGYEIKVRFSAMDILVPMGEMLNGGMIYFVRGEGDVTTQFKKNYGYMYYNFGDGEKDNWQKVPVSLKRYGDVSMSTNAVQRVEGIIGAESIGTIDANVYFYVQVVEPRNYAMLDGTYNKYVTYDYYSVPSEAGTKASSVTDEPSVINPVYLVQNEDGTEVALTTHPDVDEAFKCDFINNEVVLRADYELTTNTDGRIGYDENGKRVRSFTFTMPLKTYENKEINTDSNHTNLSFDTNSYGKKWTWTTVPETNVNYVDAIYWPIGRSMTASDLPQVYNRLTGETFSLLWDLNDLNVNRANVAVPGVVHEGDGVEILGYYMTRSGWQNADPMRLTVYIEKYDITDAIVDYAGGARITKTYDAQYYTLPFDGDYETLSLLRDDGTYATLGTEGYVIEYARVEEGRDLVWSATDLPLNAGEYYVRVTFKDEDYNTYISLTEEGYLFRLTVQKYAVDLSQIVFEGEEYGTITRTYGESGGALVVASGLPAFTPANWFYPGEKVSMYNQYFSQTNSQNLARAMGYATIRARVTDGMKEIIDGWWKEGAAALRDTVGFSSLSESEQDVAIKAWVYENRFDPDLTVVEVKVKLTYSSNGVILNGIPSDCDSYNVSVTLDEDNENYYALAKAKNVTLTIEKNEAIGYSVANPTMVYNGNAQNPEITGLHTAGTLPYGVTVTYTYEIGDKYLVVIVRGDRDAAGNTVNVVTIDAEHTTVDNPIGGIKNAQQNNVAYRCSIDIKGGKNFIDGSIGGVSVGIAQATIYVDLADVTTKYLSDVEDLAQYVRVWDSNGIEQGKGKLLGTDRLSDLGAVATYTEVGRHYKVGSYTAEIVGLRASDLSAFTYTSKADTYVEFNGKAYAVLSLKPANEDGSLFKDTTANAALIELFNNYRIFVSGGGYTIEAEDGSEGLTGDTAEELNAKFASYVAALRDGDSKILYLPELLDGEGNLTAYDVVTINVAANLTLVGYRRNASSEEDAEIITRLKGIRVLKGSVTLKILSFVGEQAGEAAIYVGQDANSVTLNNCAVTAKDGVVSAVGLGTAVNYGQRVSVMNTTFYGLSTAIDLLGGELSVSDSTFSRNYNGVMIRSAADYISLRRNTFSNSTGKAVSSTNGGVIIRDNVFEYNMVTLDVPGAAAMRADVNSNNVYTNNGDD